jgi:hypothetical protein
VDASVYIAKEGLRSFMQGYQQKYRIELSDVTPFNKEKMRLELKRQLMEKLILDQLTK